MRVGIDCTATGRLQTGLEAYTLSLATAIVQLNSSWEFVLFLAKPIPDALIPLRDRFTGIVSPFGSQVVPTQLWLASMARAHRLDLMHYPAFPPLIPPRNFVLTLHDATPWEYPHTMSRKGYLYFRSTLSVWARRANLIITVSQASQQKIMEKFGFTADKVRIIHHGVRRQLLDPYTENGSHILDRLGIQPGYILSVGSIEPRKNLPIVIKALARLRAEGLERRLLIAGRPAWGTAELTNAIDEANVADLVVVAGHVTDGELSQLYRSAAFVVQASVHEGFGLPILEAIALGCPVIASAIPAHMEVLGDAGTFFPPSDPNALAAAMLHFLRDHEACAAMKKRGLNRARAFSWERAARETIASYDDALANGTRT